MAGVLLPYSYVLEALIETGKIRKVVHSKLSDKTKLEYIGSEILEDIIKIKKDYYVVTVNSYNVPPGWLSFNELIFDLSMQCKEEISFYFPYYDLKAVNYFKDLAAAQVKKSITLYHPTKHIREDDASRAINAFRKIGFSCSFSSVGNHEKVYVFDKKAAVIGSFNFTKGGIYQNNELGILFFGEQVKVLKRFLAEREQT